MILSQRHKRLIYTLASLFCLTWFIGLYIFIIVHEHHIWSILVNAFLVFLMVITPACCYGYNVNDETVFLSNNLDENTILNYRDIGYALSILFYFLTYVMPGVAWYSSSGKNPTWIGTVIMYYANCLFMIAFIGFVKIKVVTKDNA